jgi:hypothetical protein
LESITPSTEHGDRTPGERDEKTMKKRKLLVSTLALLVLTIFNTNIHHASAPPASPYIMVVPSSQTINKFPGGNRDFTVAITTDYYNSSYDLWGYQIQLTYNTSLLQCIQVSNGNLITEVEDPTARFNVTINEAIGEVSVGAYFYYKTPPPYTTSGPGTLTSITFRVLSAGTSALILGKATKLQRFNFIKNRVENIIVADEYPDNIGHGAVTATIGDVNGDRTVNAADLAAMRNAYGSSAGPPPSPNWNANCDFYGNNRIEILDLYHQGRNYGKHW